MRKIMVGDTPHLCLFAKRDILLKEEISYDYGVANLPWRAKVRQAEFSSLYVDEAEVK